jgi:hypothetical protein
MKRFTTLVRLQNLQSNEASKVRRLMITSVSDAFEYKYSCLLGSGGTIGWYKFTTICEDAASVYRVEHFYHTVRYHVPARH